jgi:hypothetical protein
VIEEMNEQTKPIIDTSGASAHAPSALDEAKKSLNADLARLFARKQMSPRKGKESRHKERRSDNKDNEAGFAVQ